MSGVVRKIYVASSWRNTLQPEVVRVLQYDGHEVYDFRNPAPGNKGFAWSEIDPEWTGWSLKAEPELMYLLGTGMVVDLEGLRRAVDCAGTGSMVTA